MKFFKLTKNEVLVFQSILIFSLGILYLFTPYPSNVGLIISYTVLLGAFAYISGWLVGRDKENGVTDFLKTLLPASVTLAATIWLLSSGYLNVRAENLKSDINKLEKREMVLIKDSIKLFKENDLLKIEVKNSTELLKETEEILKSKEKELELFQNEIGKVTDENLRIKREFIKYKKLNLELDKEKNIYINNSIKTINYFIKDRHVKNQQNFRMECVGIHEKNGILISIFDAKKKQLTGDDVKLTTKQNRNSGYPDYQNIPLKSTKYNEKTKKFLIPHTANSNQSGRLLPGIEMHNIVEMQLNLFNGYNWSFELPFDNAEYIIYVYK